LNKITEILAELIRDCPCCSCCGGDDSYLERVVDCFRLVSEDFWPDIDRSFTNGYARETLRLRLGDIRKARLDQARKEPP